ncbi:unnamed protein product [Cuscuta europaea]|uniref:Uncharacterized protein n=2 Tax=Cuscuta europaea TaxID=41803 RepID=A0A9P0YZM0_CUSEU|nr:unnamed protein product [Cuscuta europaea]
MDPHRTCAGGVFCGQGSSAALTKWEHLFYAFFQLIAVFLLPKACAAHYAASGGSRTGGRAHRPQTRVLKEASQPIVRRRSRPRCQSAYGKVRNPSLACSASKKKIGFMDQILDCIEVTLWKK